MSKNNEQLVLEIDGPEIPAEKFEKGIHSFLNILKDVSQSVSGTKKGVKWIVEARPACIRVAYKPVVLEEADARDVEEILNTVLGGMESLETKRQERPRHFTENAAQHAKNLASILSLNADGIDTVRIWRNGNYSQVTYNTVATVNALSKKRYQDWGSLTGRLSAISEKQRLKFFIVDQITKSDVRCYFEEDIMDDVLGAFRKRIEVSGIIRYRKDGSPISIKVDELFVFPDSRDLPKSREVRGILG